MDKSRRQKAERRKEKGEREMVVNISNLTAGIYFFIITTDKGTITKKIIKQ
jgi:hypothetical protein